MNVGEYKTLKENQKAWLGWVLEDQKEWLRIHINAPENLQRLEWSYTTGLYDAVTGPLLNFILNRFNEDEITKALWRIHNKWRIKLNDKL